MFIAGENYLLVVVTEGIEEVEELFLCSLFFRHELDVVHDENVVLTVLIFEFVCPPFRDGVDEIHREALRRDVENLFITVTFFEMVPDSLDKVGFAQTGGAVD